MKNSTYHGLLATAFGLHSFLCATGAVYFALDRNPTMTIFLTMLSIFLLFLTMIKAQERAEILSSEAQKRKARSSEQDQTGI